MPKPTAIWPSATVSRPCRSWRRAEKLLDRDGRVIVDNQPAFTLLLTRENLKLEHIDGIAAGLHLDPADLRARLKRFESRPKYVPLVIKQDLTPSDIAFVESHRDADTFPRWNWCGISGGCIRATGWART